MSTVDPLTGCAEVLAKVVSFVPSETDETLETRSLLALEIADRMAEAETCEPWPAFIEVLREVLHREDHAAATELARIMFHLDAIDRRD